MKPLTLSQIRLLEACIEHMQGKSDEPDFQECYRYILVNPRSRIKESDFKALYAVVENLRASLQLEDCR